MSSETFEAPSLEHLGKHLPQYEFLDFIAQGGMGAVYVARQISLNRKVAIKVLPQELGKNKEFQDSFEKEAKAMAKLNHPNLIGVYDSGDINGMPYIVMEFIEGYSLHDACFGEKVDAKRAAPIVLGICEGLADAHQHGIVHRDIKPANILMTRKFEPKIGDFGLAHPTDSEQIGLIMGTPGYTAPETFNHPEQAGILADQYSVGVILHQLLTGEDPQGGRKGPSTSSGHILLDAIWRRATQPDPQKRYSSMADMATDIEKWQKSRTAASAASGALNISAPGMNPATDPSLHEPANSRGSGRALIKLIALAILCIVGWLAYKHYQSNRQGISEKPAPPKESQASPNSPPNKNSNEARNLQKQSNANPDNYA